MSIEIIILIVCAVVTLIVGLALIPTVVLAPLGILIITSSFMFAVMALQLYQSNESPAVTDGQVKAAYSECSSLKESKCRRLRNATDRINTAFFVTKLK